MITIYGIQSPAVARLRSALQHKSLPFEHVSVNLRQRSEEFKNLTPAETIPVMQDGDTVIGDSLAAIAYLDDKYPQTYKMLGKTPKDKGRILTAIWAIERISSPLAPLYLEKMADGLRAAGVSHRAIIYDQQQKEDVKKDTLYRLERLWKFKGEQQYFISHFSAADASMLALLKTVQNYSYPLGHWQEWYNTLMKEHKIAQMFAPDTEKGVREI
ncbi:glutathione S-transferase family protein [Candidatus Woesearchaeota archaeon]|nr:glutathione S-transferase family protein [Candidatus Woesearchaeota archaeon]